MNVKEVPLLKVPSEVPLHLMGARTNEAMARIKCCLDSANVTVQLTGDSNHFAPPQNQINCRWWQTFWDKIVCSYSAMSADRKMIFGGNDCISDSLLLSQYLML